MRYNIDPKSHITRARSVVRAILWTLFAAGWGTVLSLPSPGFGR
jgi:hypothetical protein